MSSLTNPFSEQEMEKIKQYILDNRNWVGNGPVQAVSPSVAALAPTLTGLKIDESGVTLFGRKIWDTPWSLDPTEKPGVLKARIDALDLDKAAKADLAALKVQIKALADAGSGLVGVAKKDASYNAGKNNQATLADTRAQMQHLEDAMKALAAAIG